MAKLVGKGAAVAITLLILDVDQAVALTKCPVALIAYRAHCQGFLILNDGRKYLGEFKSNEFDGKGTLTWPDGRKYVGDFVQGKHAGQGTMTFPDGKEYIGAWRNNKTHGKGILTMPDGTKHDGVWKDDKFLHP